MAIAFDSSAKAAAAGAGVTFSHTCTGSNLILFVVARTQTNLGSVTGITYNGVALTFIDSTVSAGNNNLASLWYLLAPATGAHNVVISCSAGVSNTSGVSASYTGALQSGVPDASAKDNNVTSTSLTVNLTTSAAGCWTLFAISATPTLLAGSGSTSRNIQSGTGDGGGWDTGVFDSNTVISPAGSTSMQGTYTSGAGAAVIVSFAPVIFSFSILDTVTETEAKTAIRGATFSKAETVSLSETISSIKTMVFSTLETVTLTDVFNYGAVWVRTLLSSSSWSNGSKHSSSMSQASKSSSAWVDKNKT